MPVAFVQYAQVAYVPMSENVNMNNGSYYVDTDFELGGYINQVFNNYEQRLTNGYLQYSYYSNSNPPGGISPYLMFTAVHYPTDVDLQGDWGVTSYSGTANYGTSANPVWRMHGGVIRVLNQPGVTTAYLSMIIAHEVGHTYALSDCYGCNLYSTIMLAANLFQTGSNATPTPCDLTQIRQTAYPPN